jgi:lysophospholipase L1-like esterase
MRKHFLCLTLIVAGLVFLCLEAVTRLYFGYREKGVLNTRPVLKLYPTVERPEEIFSAVTLDSLQWSPYEHWVVRPNLRSRFFRTNALGFRGPEAAAQKPPGRFRIVVIGSSAAWGLGCTADERTIPGRLQTLLRQKYPGCDLEVINAGQFGFNSTQELIYYHRVIAPLAPDLVLLFDGYNDVLADIMNSSSGWPLNADLLQSRYQDSFRRQPLVRDLKAFFHQSRFLDLISRKLSELITSTRHSSVIPVISPVTTAAVYVRNVLALSRLVAPTTVWIALQPVPACTRKPLAPEEAGILDEKEKTVPGYKERVAATYQAMEAGLRAAGLPVISLDLALGTDPRLMFADECHFGDEAADRIAMKIADEWFRSNALLKSPSTKNEKVVIRKDPIPVQSAKSHLE